MTAGSKAGRKRDPGRDGVILSSTLAVLAERGYEGMTIDLVAEHAGMARATVYRRWARKADLVLAAVAGLSRADVDVDHLPDTGSLRGDLIAMIRPFDDEQERVHMQAVIGLLTMANLDEQLGAAARQSGFAPWIEVNRFLIQRAVERGEFNAPRSIDMLAELLPQLFLARAALHRPFDREHTVDLIDGVLIPALDGSGCRADGHRR